MTVSAVVRRRSRSVTSVTSESLTDVPRSRESAPFRVRVDEDEAR